MNSDALTSQALLNCLIREVSIPERQISAQKEFLVIRLARSGPVLRTRVRRASAGLGPRVGGKVQVRAGQEWRPIGWADLAALIATELTLATGVANDEFRLAPAHRNGLLIDLGPGSRDVAPTSSVRTVYDP